MKTNKQKFKYFYFLVATAFLLLMGMVVSEKVLEVKQAKIYNYIYNELSCYVYNVKVYPDFGNGIDFESGPHNNCAGVSKNGYLFLPAHCLEIPQSSLFFKIIDMKLFVDDTYVPSNRQVHVDSVTDVAIYKLPDDMKNVKDFPCSMSDEVRLGDELFIISNLINLGTVVRKSFVVSTNLDTSTKLLNKNRCTKRTFWVDSGGFSGESGTPVVSSDYKLVGLVACSLNPVFMGVKYIGEYARHIE